MSDFWQKLVEIAGTTNQSEIARQLDIPTTTLSNWLSRGVSKAGALKIAKTYGVNIDYILGQGEMTANTGNISIGGNNAGMVGGQGNTQNNYGLLQTVLPTPNTDNSPTYLKDMPLLDIDDGVKFALDPHSLDGRIFDASERAATFIPHSGRTFGVKNNIELHGIALSTIRKNDILIIEPCIAPRNDDLVLLCVDYGGTNRGVIARLGVDLMGNQTVKYNDTPAVAVPASTVICGVVIEIKRRLLDNALALSRLNPNYDILTSLT